MKLLSNEQIEQIIDLILTISCTFSIYSLRSCLFIILFILLKKVKNSYS
jgi:hypothetical protein